MRQIIKVISFTIGWLSLLVSAGGFFSVKFEGREFRCTDVLGVIPFLVVGIALVSFTYLITKHNLKTIYYILLWVGVYFLFFAVQWLVEWHYNFPDYCSLII